MIEFINDAIKVEKEASPEGYWDYIQKSLDNPKDIWRGMIETQISDLDRHIVIAIVLNGSPVSEEQVVALLINLKESGLDPTSEYPTIGNIMRGLVGSVLNRNINKDGQVTYSLFNPSIADFVISEHLNRVDYLEKLMSCLRTKNALDNIDRLIKSNKKILDFDTLLIRLFQSELYSELTPDLYSIQLIELTEKLECDIPKMVKKLVDSYSNNLFKQLGLPSIKILKMAIDCGLIASSDVYMKEVVNKALEGAYFDDLKEIAKLIHLISGADQLIKAYKKKVVNFLQNNITDWAMDHQIFEDSYAESDGSIAYDENQHYYVVDTLNELDCGFDFTRSEVQSIEDSIDIDRIIDFNNERESQADRAYDEYKDAMYDRDFSSDSIDDLFNR
ncbi:hypothetical protein [Psychrobacter sp. TWP2-1-2]|uniref:hypothetical protein n=1 Tax=Psychrobacter sp. TWP2-1-2 TaxID=2804623 RepID=UPI003CE8B6B0